MKEIKDYLNKSSILKSIDLEKKKISYKDIVSHRKIDKISGEEELVRAFIITRLVEELGYDPKNIEIEKEYDLGRPKVNKPRIDIIVRDKKKDIFLYIECKKPSEFNKDQDEIIEKKLFNLASQEIGEGKRIKYLVLYTYEKSKTIKDNAIIIDYEKFKSFSDWKDNRDFTDQIPLKYGKAVKEPFIKGSKKDLEQNFVHDQLEALRKNLHNVLWGGGGTDDNDIFSSLVNIILAKIQDESERKRNEKYEFQIFSYANGESFESNDELFARINGLYKRALQQRLNIKEKKKLEKSYVIDENKFSLNKLKYTVSQLEKYSFVDGKNSLSGKDILGDFFEGIIREGFKQTKGQFFTHLNIVKFLLWGLKIDDLAIKSINNNLELPYVIDPSAGSGTFLIEYMKFLTDSIKRRFRDEIDDTRDIEDKFNNWFLPDNRENKWAKDYIYGVEHNFNLGTATKVNMILHGDGASNIFVKDGLLPFKNYEKEISPNELNKSYKDKNYNNINVNNKFDVVISNPPFSVELDKETEKNLKHSFLFGDKKNSENFFIERYYQLLKPKGRLGIVLPESVFDTTENKYIRLFIYKYFKIKSVISLPQITFEPYTSTKTSLLLAQKKDHKEIEQWDEQWKNFSSRWSFLVTRTLNLRKIYLEKKDRKKFPSVSNLNEEEERKILLELLSENDEQTIGSLNIKDILNKYEDDLKTICKIDNDTKNIFGFVNTTWVFSKVSKKIDYSILMHEIENVGYKRSKRGEKIMPNDLYRTNQHGEIIVNDGKKIKALDFLREINWD